MGARVLPIVLLIGSNIFMTFAWYGHLKFKEFALWKVILVSWLIALFEYCLQVPANRMGSQTYSPDQLKVIQEVITLTVFGVFSAFYFGDKLHWNHAVPGGRCILHVPQIFRRDAGMAPKSLVGAGINMRRKLSS